MGNPVNPPQSYGRHLPHGITQGNTDERAPARKVGILDLPTPEGWKAVTINRKSCPLSNDVRLRHNLGTSKSHFIYCTLFGGQCR